MSRYNKLIEEYTRRCSMLPDEDTALVFMQMERYDRIAEALEDITKSLDHLTVLTDLTGCLDLGPGKGNLCISGAIVNYEP